MLRIQNLSKTYSNGVRALDGVNLEIPKGMFGLLGPNGAGKSTLMRTIATLQDADSGAIDFAGVDVGPNRAEIRRILGYLPQEFGVYPRVSAAALLDHFAVLKGITAAAQRQAAVADLLRMTNLWQVRKQKLGSFSGGMRRRFGIAQALLGEPQLLVVDEPTAGLDPEERRRFLNLLSEIGENVVVILSTHIVDDVREVCARLAVIDRGQLLVTGQPQGLISDLAGKIWRKEVARHEVSDLSSALIVLSQRQVAGRTIVRVASDSPPGDGFTAAEPDLEDVYFAALKGHR